jgi:hypothetical protein
VKGKRLKVKGEKQVVGSSGRWVVESIELFELLEFIGLKKRVGLHQIKEEKHLFRYS